MALFRMKPVQVDAEPYRSGLEDEFSDRNVPVLVTHAGRFELAQGDWIITKETGEREVISAQVFEELYERCSKNTDTQISERVLRGIPMRSG